MHIRFGFQGAFNGPESVPDATESLGVGVGQGAENFSADLLSEEEPDYAIVAHTPIGLAHFHADLLPRMSASSESGD